MIETLFFLVQSLARHLFYPICTGTSYLLVFIGGNLLKLLLAYFVVVIHFVLFVFSK